MCLSLTSLPLCFFSFLTIFNSTAEFKLVTRSDITFESFIFFLSLSFLQYWRRRRRKKNQWTRLYPLRHDSKLEIMRYCREQRQTARQLLECCLSLWIVLVTRRSPLRSGVLACARNKWMFASSTARVAAGLGCAGDGSRQFFQTIHAIFGGIFICWWKKPSQSAAAAAAAAINQSAPSKTRLYEETASVTPLRPHLFCLFSPALT